MNPLHEELTAYLDGELPPDRVRELEAALAADPALRALEARLRASLAALEALPNPEPAPSAALRRAVLDAVSGPTWAERWLTWPRWAPLGLALAAAAVAVLAWPRPGDEASGLDEERLLLAQNLEEVEDLDLVGLETEADLEVIAALHELEEAP